MPWKRVWGSGLAMAAICGKVMPSRAKGTPSMTRLCQGRLASYSCGKPCSRSGASAGSWLLSRLAASTG
ncbi:hypothetical protein D3C84_593390 [compost metagenome]